MAAANDNHKTRESFMLEMAEAALAKHSCNKRVDCDTYLNGDCPLITAALSQLLSSEKITNP